jgi:phosphoglycerol transferase MdoB-like AlkP superfamily enzyme
VVDSAQNIRLSRSDEQETHGSLALAFLKRVVVTFLAAAIFVFLVECLARGSVASAFGFFATTDSAAWATVALVGFVLLLLDALTGRAFQALLALGPLALILPFINFEKLNYLSDPLFPTDFLFARQIVDIAPLLIDDRPLAAVAVAVGVVAIVAFVACVLFVWRRRFPSIPWKGRAARLVIALPALLFFYSISDYATYSWVRDRLQIIPMMWDQKANYDHNGFIMAFALNVPMAHVEAPQGYTAKAMNAMKPTVGVSGGATKPDVIMVMSESFWDPTRLPGMTFTPDPMPHVRKAQSGYMFSPEFGGMTADIEFEALTGFSNAFLPYGSIPYQQYIRRPTPSLARFFKSQGYTTRAIHPFQAWFWNRGNVYDDFGFDKFMSEENLPPLEKRGPLASDAALTEEVIKEAESVDGNPLFFFVVTLQGHGPYEAHRYAHTSIDVKAPGMSDATVQSALSYAEGISDADKSLNRRMEWAKNRSRPTILVFFGDHLPPLGPVYVETGFLKNNVAPRKAPVPDMLRQHETPLVVWSNREGTVDTGTISPSLIPREILELAGMTHPYYTGFLGQVHDKYRVIERQLLLKPDGKTGLQNWVGNPKTDPIIKDYRLLQYDAMFGKGYARDAFFPAMDEHAQPRSAGVPVSAAGRPHPQGS